MSNVSPESPYQLSSVDYREIEKISPSLSMWMRSMEDSTYQRATGPDKVRYLTSAEVQQQTLASIAAVFSSGPSGVDATKVPTVQQINYTIEQLQDEIRKSLIYQTLENLIGDIDLTTIAPEIAEQVGTAMAAIASERKVRANKDNALASAILNMWASIGGTTSVIQDGQLAAVTPSTAQATKWNQVVASVTDPNTGNVNSASIKQELNAYANAANGTFNSIYSVRAQVDVGGRTVVGGFGLSATAGAGSGQGATIDFGVRADKFFIAATSATPDGTTQENQGNSIPFMVLTYPQYVNGVLYGAGVFIKQATIGDATIGTAKIADAAITDAKIGNIIKSYNWDGGSAGWAIVKDGNAYFRNIYARGDIQASSLNANTVSADQIVSESLNKFYSTTGPGYIDVSHDRHAYLVRAACNPGMYPDGKEATPRPNLVYIFVDTNPNYFGVISVDGFVNIYNLPAGTQRIWFRKGASTGFPVFTGRIDAEVIVR